MKRLWPPRRVRVRVISLAALATASLALSGCGDAGRSPGSRTADDSSSTLTLLVLGASARHVTRAVNLRLQQLVFSPLFHGYHEGGSGKDGMPAGVEGRLVRRVEALPDGSTWRYHLRTDVRWHDGVPFTARDVEFTFSLYGPPAWTHLDANRVTVKVENDSTFTMAFHYDADPFDTYTTFLPAHLLEELDPSEIDSWDFWDRPVGNGPYRFVRAESDAFVVLDANPDHYRGEPRIGRVILRLTGGASETAWLELQAGNADVANWNIGEGGKLTELAARDEDFVVYTRPDPLIMSILWNLRDPRFRDRRVREAFALAVDREELATFLQLPPEIPLHDGPINESLLRARSVVPPTYRPDSARALLDRAGWIDEDGDGVREREGRELRFEVLTRGPPPDELLVVREHLRRVGAAMEVVGPPPQSYDGRFREGAFDGIVAALDISNFAHDGPQTGHRHRRACCLRNGYEDPEIVALDSILQARVWLPEDSVMLRFGEIIRRDRPALTLVPRALQLLAHRRVRGLSSETIRIALHMDELWLEDEP